MNLHEKQKEVVRSPARFKIVRAGRRSGKTTLEIEDMAFTAMSENDSPVFYIAPTQKQARELIWEELKSRLAGIGQPSEQRLEMAVPTRDGGRSLISVAGWENRENFRGKKAKKIFFDEVDTMKDFFIAWQEIFRPALIDYGGDAMFAGTPRKENPNLRRLEKMVQQDSDYEAFHFPTMDNPFVPRREIEKARTEMPNDSFRQEILAEYLENAGALFHYDALLDVFSNTISKDGEKYLIVDIADDGSDKTIFSFWNSLEEYRREEFERLNTEGIINHIREFNAQDKIPYSHTAVDAIGVGAGVASSSMLDGVVGFKSSYQPIKTEKNISVLEDRRVVPVTSDFRNLRSQCVFFLADYVNNHKIASRVTGRFKEWVIEELAHYQDASKGDGKRLATLKEEVKEIIGRSPDHSDTWIMRMYFEIRGSMIISQSPQWKNIVAQQDMNFMQKRYNQVNNDNR